MNFETLSSLIVFAIATSITPGPNNLILVATGVNFGFKKTLPIVFGVFVGFYVMQLTVGLGLGSLLVVWPQTLTVMKLAGAAFLVYIAFRLLISKRLPGNQAVAKPMSFTATFFFQWANPKGVLLAASAMSIYVDPEHTFTSVLSVAAIYSSIMLPSNLIWAVGGVTIRKFLEADPVRLLWFNRLMAILLLVCVGLFVV